MGDLRDPEFDAYLRGNSEVSRTYRQLRGAQVPAEIDRKLAGHARVVHTTARSTLRSFETPLLNKPSWFAPFTLAASVLLSAAVLLAIAFDHRTHKGGDDSVRMIPAAAAHGERSYLHAPPPTAAQVPPPGSRSAEVVPRLFESRRLFTSDPPNSRDKQVDGALMPLMPVEVIRRDPREWQARIEHLREAGRHAEAERELQEFNKVFPNYAHALR
jgi:hypothetical protein